MHDIEWSIWEAFGELNTTRVEMGPIPWSSIQQYAEKYSAVETVTFTKIIRTIDNAYLGHRSGETREFSREMLRRG